MASPRGFNTSGDVLVNITADGVDLQVIWAEIKDALDLYNSEKSAVTKLLSYPTINVADVIPQSVGGDSFEEASEFGQPTALREPADYLRLGYNFKDWDKSLRSTWKFLRDATAEQVTAQVTRIFASDTKLTCGTIMNRLLNPTVVFNEWQNSCYGLWNNDGMVPPPYLGKTFLGTHTHYLTSGSVDLDALDVEILLHHITEHGYGLDNNGQLVILINPTDFEASLASSWRAGVEYTAGHPVPKWDFIPSALLPAWISNETIHGPTPPDNFNGLRVWGSYGNAYIIQSNYVPKGYVIAAATGGPNSDANPVGFREHVNPAYQGLRHIPGTGTYPLVDSFFVRSFGTGVRTRGAAAVMQITANANYTAPVVAT